MGASWFFDLCDANGSRLDELTTAAGRQLSFKRNAYAEVQFALSHEDEAAELLLGAVANTGMPSLKCWRKPRPGATAVLRFNGDLSPFQEEVSDTALLTPIFRSPFARVMGDGSGAGRFTGSNVVFASTDAGSIGSSLLTTTNADGATGLIPGTVELTKTRDRTYERVSVGQAITDLSAVLDGFDFYETYLDAGITRAQLDIVAHQGSVNPGAAFGYGPETLNNVQSVSRTTAPPINSVTVVGANGLTSTKTDTGSIAKYGLYPVLITASDVSEQATLDDVAYATLRPSPVKTVSFTPEPAFAPAPWDDYWLGDTVSFYARRGALTEDVDVRVNAITVVVDENGKEVAEIPDPTTPGDEASIRASLELEVVTS